MTTILLIIFAIYASRSEKTAVRVVGLALISYYASVFALALLFGLLESFGFVLSLTEYTSNVLIVLATGTIFYVLFNLYKPRERESKKAPNKMN